MNKVNHYYPYGGLMGESTNSEQQPYKYNGKELDRHHGLDWFDYGARWYDGGRFNTMDRFAEKYPSLTPYGYCAGNPINYIDINGDSIWITYRGNDYRYHDGAFYNKDGSVYNGKIKGFLAQGFMALNTLRNTAEGAAMISELQSSTNNFTIVKGDSRFIPTSSHKSHANQLKTDPAQTMTFQALIDNGIDFSGGSGGTIFWNPLGVMLPTTNGVEKNGITDLAHEMFHGLDANRGLLDDRVEQGVERSKWQATYRENIVRFQLGKPLRTHYKKSVDINGNFQGGYGPYMLTPSKKTLLPSWYSH